MDIAIPPSVHVSHHVHLARESLNHPMANLHQIQFWIRGRTGQRRQNSIVAQHRFGESMPKQIE
jgi:hypothetical protein